VTNTETHENVKKVYLHILSHFRT